MHIARLCKGALVLLLLATSLCLAQQKRERFEAMAHGQGNQSGMSIGLTAIIEKYSTAEEQKVLWEAFDRGGDQGLLDALVKLPTKGRLLFTGVSEYEIVYARQFPAATGRKIRLVARRPLAAGEVAGYRTHSDYRVSAVELDVNPAEGKSTGAFLPVCEFSINKETGIETRAYRDAWRLQDITVRNEE